MATAADSQVKPKRYSSYIDADVLSWLRQRGKVNDWTVSQQIRRILRDAMDTDQRVRCAS